MTLKGYTDNSNAYEYVLFGRYPQSYGGKVIGGTQPSGIENRDWLKAQNAKDSNADYYYIIDPIVWRVLSTDVSGSGRKALWFSHSVLWMRPGVWGQSHRKS